MQSEAAEDRNGKAEDDADGAENTRMSRDLRNGFVIEFGGQLSPRSMLLMLDCVLARLRCHGLGKSRGVGAGITHREATAGRERHYRDRHEQ